ncbi:MAG TPA: fatty acid hydroxylase, partial [Cyclobacteriaceae bacterium]|nr:fatty acid hydroxylase [Cyclobacteriaceae bacterium]
MSAEIKPQNKGTKQLFENPILEKLSRTHISVPLIIFFTYAAGLLYWSVTHTALTAGVTVGLFVIGLLSFTWVEYNVHR